MLGSHLTADETQYAVVWEMTTICRNLAEGCYTLTFAFMENKLILFSLT